MDLADIRQAIDGIDTTLLNSFVERMDIATEVAKSKIEMGKAVFDPARERSKLNNLASRAPERYEAQTITLFRLLMSMSKAEQQRYINELKGITVSQKAHATAAASDTPFPQTATVACQGVEGAYSQIAACKLFDVPDIAFFETFEGVMRAVRDGFCEFGVLPIENSTAGSVNAVYDLLAQFDFHIVRSLRLKVQDRPVELLFGDHEEQCRIVGDKNRLMQVITNFINNAVKFTEQGSITLGYRREAGDLLFYVEDTGKGISEEHLRTVFDRFVKLNSFAQGTGLGLSISKSIVEQMGGHIGVESEEGRGSRFWFTIPAVACNAGPDDEPSVVAEAPHPVSRQDGKLPLLLVAEDTDSNFLLVSLMFRKEFDIVRAVNGEEAVRICREMNPAAILMDIKMPVMDGFEATRQIRRFDPAVPIVAVTAFAYDRDRQKALAAGANEYVAKPLSGEHIRRVLGTLLAGV